MGLLSHKWLFPTALTVLAAMACASHPKQTQQPMTDHGRRLTETLSHLNLDNPPADVDEAMKNGDRRFVGVCGFACLTPGIDSRDGTPIPTRILEGTSDVLVGPEAALMAKAEEYARAYNANLRERLEK